MGRVDERQQPDRRGCLMTQIEDQRQADENEIVRDIGSDYAAKYGFHNGDTPEEN